MFWGQVFVGVLATLLRTKSPVPFAKDSVLFPISCPMCPISPRGGRDECTPTQVFPVDYLVCFPQNHTCLDTPDTVRNTHVVWHHRRSRLVISASAAFAREVERPLTAMERARCVQQDNQVYMWLLFLMMLVGTCSSVFHHGFALM